MTRHATIKVLYFASIREQVGRREEQLALDVAADGDAAVALTLAHVRRRLCEKYPGASDAIGQIALAKNLEYADDDTPVHDGDEVALIPPISGG